MPTTQKPPSAPQRVSLKELNANLSQEVMELKREHDESLAREAATSEILRMIAKSPADIQSVLDTIAENSARLCGADDAVIWRVEGDSQIPVAHFGSIRLIRDIGVAIPIAGAGFTGRAIREARTLHVHDLRDAEAEFPGAKLGGLAVGVRRALLVPLLKDGKLLGIIHIRRLKVQPFTEQQIRLVETFADQAVIAIENVRLFQELKESLEQQTATSEILGVIASSPTDIQPVLDVVVENAARLCEASDAQILRIDGDILRLAASYGPLPTSQTRPINRQLVSGRAVIDRQTIHVHDISVAEDEFPYTRTLGIPRGIRTFLATPLLCKGDPIGAIVIRRTEVCPFSEKQIALLKIFADQAVIAIENVRLFQELKESLEQQHATSEILGVIASSPTDIQPVLDAVAASAARLCDATDAVIHTVEDDSMKVAANYGPLPGMGSRRGVIAITRANIPSRAVIDGRTIHIRDLLAEPVDDLRADLARSLGVRTALSTPLLREGKPVGAITIRRIEIRPFTDKQIKLLETFADQAVIAIENVRLFNELEQRNHDLTEALEQQTATSEILRVIASSHTDVQPVFETILANAVRLCGNDVGALFRFDGEFLRLAASHNVNAEIVARQVNKPTRPGKETAVRRAALERRTIHVPDVRAATEFAEYQTEENRQERRRSTLAVPLLKEDTLLGVIVTSHYDEVKPFTETEIKLVETFADQAVIAIENVRLFQELKESLEQQTATSEILGVIASSPTDIQPVLNVVAENAARLCEARDTQIRLVEGDGTRLVASFGTLLSPPEFRPTSLRVPSGRALHNRETVHVHDLLEAAKTEFPDSKFQQSQSGTRTFLSTPMLREGTSIGVINIRRTEVRPFSDRQLKLLETFASQAVIAIENVRLFKELQERNTELREALEHQTATAEVLGIISRSPTDVQPVLDAIVESAARVCGIDDVVLRLRVGNVMVRRAHFGPMPIGRVEVSIDEPQYRWMREHGALHIPDIRAQNDFPMLGSLDNYRTFLAAPLRQMGELVGVLG